jgi:phosphoserine phosphatase
MNNPTTFYIVRHGQTEWNVIDIIQGHKDSPLTEKGINDAKDTAIKFKNIKFDLIFSSDLLRAKRTAEIIALEHKLEVQTNKLLRERKFGQLEGKSKKEFENWTKVFEELTDEERFVYKSSPDIESDEEIVNRLITFMREIAMANPNKNILAVSHGGIMRILLIHLGFASYKSVGRGAIRNGGFIKIQSDGVEFEIIEISGIKINNYVK